jgi:hypothetical protein
VHVRSRGSPAQPFIIESGTDRFIERTLKSQKLDWHDVASAVAQAAPPTQWYYEPRHTEGEIRAWLMAISREDWPNEWTVRFIGDLLRRRSLHNLSERQTACINRIISEAFHRGVRPRWEAA